jgi:hypothetical protein
MNMLSFFKSDRLTPEWTFSAGSIIWRMVLSDGGIIVGECRDPEKKTASFFGVDVSTGTPVWRDLLLHDPWWVGIEGVQKNVALFHGFVQPDMPEHRGIQAFDVQSGSLLWRNDEVTYWFGYENRVVAYRDLFEKRVGYELDLQTGSLLETHDTSLIPLHAMRQQASGSLGPSDVVLPETVAENEGGSPLATAVQKETGGKELIGRVEYVRHKDILVFNYHVQRRNKNAVQPKLENTLAVYRAPGAARLFSDVIGRDLALYVPDSFFVKYPFIVFVKDRTILTALKPWKS